MNFIKYLKLLRNPNEKYYWYDVDKECIYIPGEDIALNLTIDEIDSIIFHRKKFKKTSKELFERIIFNEKVTFWTLNYFIKEYEKGLMDPMIKWIVSKGYISRGEHFLDSYLLSD